MIREHGLNALAACLCIVAIWTGSVSLLLHTIGLYIAAHALLAKGDLDGMLVWNAVIRSIERLQQMQPAEGEPVQ